MIRQATLGDVPILTAMAEKFFAGTTYAKLFPFDAEAMMAAFERMIEMDEATVLIAEDDGPVGMIGLVTVPLYMSPANLVCNEIFWWVDPAKRGAGLALVRAADQWRKSKGVQVFALASLADDTGDRLSPIYERMGFAPAEILYVKGL